MKVVGNISRSYPDVIIAPCHPHRHIEDASAEKAVTVTGKRMEGLTLQGNTYCDVCVLGPCQTCSLHAKLWLQLDTHMPVMMYELNGLP